MNGNNDEQQIFWLKACGDYYRYLAEFKSDEKCKQLTFECMDLAEGKLPCTNAIRLGLALNFSVCYCDILNQKKMHVILVKNHLMLQYNN